jgi:TonB family protein
VFLDRLQSGFLLFQTRQGLVRVDLSLRQRIYLLWTFRNFRQLSIPLLNSRQRELVNALFRNSAGVVSHFHNRTLAIGVVENFVPPPVPIDASPAQIPVQIPVQIKERQEKVAAQQAEIAPKPNPVPSSSPRFAWFKLAKFKLATFKLATSKLATSKLVTSKLATSKLVTSMLATSRLATSKLATSRLAMSRLATTGGALCLCIISVVAWHRIEGIPSSQAHNQPRLQPINMTVPPNSPRVAKPAAAIAESPTAIAPSAAAHPLAAPEAAVTPASINAVIPASIRTSIPTAIPTPKRAIRVHDAVSAPNLPLSGQDSGIQASRAPLHFAYPDYPDARARGVVALTARVDSAGAVRTVRVVSGDRALAAAAVRAVRQWRYRPYVKDGQPVATETNIVISFIAEDAISMSFPPNIRAPR